MHFTQYIAPSLLLAGSAVASNIKRSDHAYDSADSQSYDASYDYADKSGDDYAAPAEYVDDYAAPAEYGDDYTWSSTWDAQVTSLAAEPTGQWKDDAYVDEYDYDYSDTKDTTWVTDVDAAEPTGKWMKDEEDCDDDVPVVEEECSDEVDDSMVQIIKVSDKDGNLVFSPNDIKAPVGSYVQFHFWPKVRLLAVMYVFAQLANCHDRTIQLSSLTLPTHVFPSTTSCQRLWECSQASCPSAQTLRKLQFSHTKLPTKSQFGSTAPRACTANPAWAVSSMRKHSSCPLNILNTLC